MDSNQYDRTTITKRTNGQTTMKLLDYVQLIGNRICSLVSQINTINNSITNLQLLTNSENTRKAYANKNLKGIRMKAIPIIARNYDTKAETTYESISKAATALEIEPARISSLLKGKGRTVMGKKTRYEFAFVQEPHQRPSSQPEPARESVLEVQVQQVLSSEASVSEKPMVKRSVVDWLRT